ncbi:MAG: hypothetical protein WDN69_00110 [Aliidongia sp.]
MLHLGLRRGELLLRSAKPIECDFDYETGRDRCWINIDETPYEDEDTRYRHLALSPLSSERFALEKLGALPAASHILKRSSGD